MAEDFGGLTHAELALILSRFAQHKLLTVEIAFDFASDLGFGAAFIRRHVVCGKSRLQTTREHLGEVHFGSRKSEKFVRCYEKPTLGAFRIELELHSGWLMRNGLVALGDLAQVSNRISPAHFEFVRIDWSSLTRHLSKLGVTAPHVLTEMRNRDFAIRRALGCMAKQFGLKNVHRFRRRLELNLLVRQSLRSWAKEWRRSERHEQ